MTLSPPRLNMRRLSVHIGDATLSRSALHNPSERAQRSPWSERIFCILIGAGAVLAGLALKAWAMLP